MTRVELALILKIIDAHTVTRSYNYGAPDSIHINDVRKLKDDIIMHYNDIMKNEGEETI